MAARAQSIPKLAWFRS